MLIETEYALALCTARFVADRNAVVRGSSPRGRNFWDGPRGPMQAPDPAPFHFGVGA